MWRAWGIALWVLAQDQGAVRNDSEHEFSIRPPAGWVARPGLRPTVVRYLHPAGDKKADAELQIAHLITTNPTPIKSFEEQAKQHIVERYKGATVHEQKSLVVGGRPAFRVRFSHENVAFIKTAIQRTNLEYYLLDIVLPKDSTDALRAAAEAAVDTFQIVPVPLSPEESGALARGLDVLRSAKPAPASLGERWYGLYIGAKKAGHQRMKLTESEGLLAFELDVVLDLGEGNRDASTVKGAFAFDGRVQRLESEQVKTNDKKERWQFRASADLRDGKLKVSRDMNGVKEEKTLDVQEGLLLADVAEFFRGRLALHGKGSTLIKTISPFSDEPNLEMVEAGAPEMMDVDGRRGDAVVALSKVDRRKIMAYTYGTDHVLLRQGGGKDIFSVRALSKDEALKQP
ncbi:MAG TPA: hypothetical protein VF950_23265 [Planctomycetota bacterium]